MNVLNEKISNGKKIQEIKEDSILLDVLQYFFSCIIPSLPLTSSLKKEGCELFFPGSCIIDDNILVKRAINCQLEGKHNEILPFKGLSEPKRWISRNSLRELLIGGSKNETIFTPFDGKIYTTTYDFNDNNDYKIFQTLLIGTEQNDYFNKFIHMLFKWDLVDLIRFLYPNIVSGSSVYGKIGSGTLAQLYLTLTGALFGEEQRAIKVRSTVGASKLNGHIVEIKADLTSKIKNHLDIEKYQKMVLNPDIHIHDIMEILIKKVKLFNPETICDVLDIKTTIYDFKHIIEINKYRMTLTELNRTSSDVAIYSLPILPLFGNLSNLETQICESLEKFYQVSENIPVNKDIHHRIEFIKQVY